MLSGVRSGPAPQRRRPPRVPRKGRRAALRPNPSETMRAAWTSRPRPRRARAATAFRPRRRRARFPRASLRRRRVPHLPRRAGARVPTRRPPPPRAGRYSRRPRASNAAPRARWASGPRRIPASGSRGASRLRQGNVHDHDSTAAHHPQGDGITGPRKRLQQGLRPVERFVRDGEQDVADQQAGPVRRRRQPRRRRSRARTLRLRGVEDAGSSTGRTPTPSLGRRSAAAQAPAALPGMESAMRPKIIALMATTSPRALSNGPPEFPGASVTSERT